MMLSPSPNDSQYSSMSVHSSDSDSVLMSAILQSEDCD